VNNAGFIVYGKFSETPYEDEYKMMQLHMNAMTHMMKLFVPEMIKNESGRILNIGSTGSFVPGPYNAIYCATKSYVLSLSEAVAEELRFKGVTVTTLCPGGTMTEFHSRAVGKPVKIAATGGMKPKRVASIAYRALLKGNRVVVPGLYNKLQVFAVRFLPGSAVTRITGKMMSEYK
jgi:short-subunit dehydrogenase